MPRTMQCPYLTYCKGYCVHCEAGVLRFTGYREWDGYTRKFCADINGWKSCVLAQVKEEEYAGEGETKADGRRA